MASEEPKQEQNKEEVEEEVHYAGEEYAVNDYVPPAEYTVPKGYYNDNGEFIEYSEYEFADPNNQLYPDQYYYGYDYNYHDPNNAAYQYDQQQQYYYDYSKNTASTKQAEPTISASAAVYTPPTATQVAKPSFYPPIANSNNPIGPVTITRSGYTGGIHSASSPMMDSSRNKKKKPVVRAAGGEVWEDNTLADWDDSDFRLFAGDLGNEVTEELLYKTFSKYPSLVRTRVVRDSRTMKSKGYGFISFRDPDDFVRAWREMNGKYVGNRPIKLRKSNWKERNIDVKQKKERERFGPYTKHK
ncbi:uncharacterized protein B0P05DRAFT_469558 [Gilbertella persicaria]|uniref:uncharacterized protein n=1 Tax=Gilbertella persicaria TaxID=101096 RepID=UPI0022202F00|nr:uncharacterized protein B0P05DRAFT_469558 [Gilbertella persicaria]KAI8080272.1 hypothetical protein B0P05DRAFT_469558 [Gilbertella persicaria]